MKFTPDQQKAISLSGDSLLVSAAAGSGKTAVLTERVVQRIIGDNAPDIDSFLILTFTIAAAEEMRSRISKRLKELLPTHKNPQRIKEQIKRLPSAVISTIDSACLGIVKENFERLGLDPQFTIADDSQTVLEKIEELDEFIEEIYQRAKTDDNVKALVDWFVTGKSDDALFTAINTVSEFLEKQPFAKQIIKTTCELDVIKQTLAVVDYELANIIKSYDENVLQRGFLPITNALGPDLDGFKLVYKYVIQGDFDKAVETAHEFKFKDFPKGRPKDINKSEWEGVKAIRDSLKKRFLKIKDELLYDFSSVIIADREIELPVIKMLLELCLELNNRLKQKRKEKRVATFDDVKKYAIELLVESYDGKSVKKTELAKELSGQFTEIIVDEYQDCDITQEIIFLALSREGKNIFTVGDVKQSIYRFRGAEPQLFLQKQKGAAYPTGDVLTQPTRVDLSKNFRSHPTVIKLINKIFYMLMTESRGIDYHDSHELFECDIYDNTNEASVDISLVLAHDEPKLDAAARLEYEAAYVAKKIKSIIGTQKIFDAKEGKERYVTAGDIAILMSSPKRGGVLFEKALIAEGIGCVNNNPAEKYLAAPEVREIVAYLQAIDNPYNDIPLVTLMYSQYFGFSVDELGKIRAGAKGKLFYDAVVEYAKTDKKTADFVNTLSELRQKSTTSSVYDLLNAIYEKSSVMTRLANTEGGDSKCANLLMLCDIASAFEASRYRGLFSFINYIIKLYNSDKKMPLAKLNDAKECVSLLSIHKSKGLEYPVVFLVSTAAKVEYPERKSMLYDTTYGVGGMIKDTKNHREVSGIVRKLIDFKAHRDDINESIRLLYVALTRACSRLYITGSMTVKNAIETIKYCDALSAVTDADIVGASFFEWILANVIRTKNAAPFRSIADLDACFEEGGFNASIVFTPEIELGGITGKALSDDKITIDADSAKSLITRTADVSDTPSKLSVSEIKAEMAGGGKNKASYPQPRFMQGGITGADRGSATHKFLQFCNFDAIFDSQSYDNELERLVEDEFILKSEAELCDKDKIIRFVTNELLKSLNSSGICHKEERILFSLDADEIYKSGSSDQIIIQGVLDLWYEIDGCAVIVDYKTDKVKTKDELIERYSVQLDMYQKALERIYNVKTDKKYIYSFALEQFILL